MPDTQVLIVGAGPTGLVLALCLTRLGVRLRVVDKTDGPGTSSRALAMHARTLEFYRQLGIAQAAIEGGVKFTALNLWADGRHAARVPFGDIGAGLSAYPFILIYPQDQHERMLVDTLRGLGVEVERKTELVSLKQAGNGVLAQLKTADGTVHPCEAEYLAGCDGAHSTVREELGIGFPGGTYSGLFYVADIVGDGPPVNGELNVALDDADLLAIFPMKGSGSVRLVGNVGSTAGQADHLGWEHVSRRILERLNLNVEQVRWFSTYHVHHRVATAFRRECAFLLGDAAHIHSPVGGQGMNTGIGDAVNLAWKLSAVLQQRIDPSVLDTYETERIAFARQLVRSTDRAFQFASAHGPTAAFVRLHLVPFLLPRLVRYRAVRRWMFRTLSQIAIKYPQSRLSAGSAGRVRGGDRLPWIGGSQNGDGGPDNYAALESRDWQVHCYGDPTPGVRVACEKRGLALHAFSWTSSMAPAGLKRNAVYLIRPDGHIGLAEPSGDAAGLERYVDQHRIQPGLGDRRDAWARPGPGQAGFQAP
jgi:2-polyprenyl-6-methoxyphenol hydroxylase-like FAD-dependent oxidoreductase